jgi:sulfate adenylyltransferase
LTVLTHIWASPVLRAQSKFWGELQDGPLFGLPVVLDTSDDDIKVGSSVLLTYQRQAIGICKIDSKWVPNKAVEALKCYGTTSIEHPAVHMITTERGKYYMGMLLSTSPR